jgi:prepilin-type N-terminal cleavage/methylation domain-containing protein
MKNRHTATSFTRRSRRRGFTLVELVIVASLIAIFSGLAVFSIQQQFRNNQVKATIAETRNIAATLDLAHLDVSMFPKLCWLDQSETGLRFIGVQLFGTGAASAQIFNNMEIGQRSTFNQAFSISQNWRGSYFAMSQSRAGSSQGRGGIVNMILPEYASLAGGADGFRWPADPYGSPYVVYMLNVDRDAQTLFFINDDPVHGDNPGFQGDYINAVVSYGPNQVPGGGANFRTGLINPAAGAGTRRLYNQTLAERFEYLEEADFQGPSGERLANIWKRTFNFAAGFADTDMAPNPDIDSTTGVGITDRGSDDVIFEF